MIFFDTETTGLVQPGAIDISKQPHIIEICCIKTGNDLRPIKTISSYVKPPIPVPEEITKITNITDSDIRDAPTFYDIYPKLADFFLGEDILIAHNVAFDREMLVIELSRIEKQFKFPWPKTHICTVEAAIPITGKRLGLADLYEIATGRKIQNHHTAEGDVRSLIECFRYLAKEGLIV